MARKTGVLKAAKAAVVAVAGSKPTAQPAKVASVGVAATPATVVASGTPPTMRANKATYAAVAVVTYIGPSKELTGVKYGGTKQSMEAIQQLFAAAGPKGTVQWGQVVAAVKGCGNPGFAKYAVRMGWLQVAAS